MVVTALATMVAAAQADPIPGASYSGPAADGATVSFTVSADGTALTSYRILNVRGDTCQFTGGGDASFWEGAPIVAGSFEYHLRDALAFQGTFPGAQSASGTFRFYNPATSATAACDSGTVSWTATTSATPPVNPGGTPGGTPGPKPKFASRVVFRKLSKTRLGGRIKSPSGVCRAGRTVTLWRGQHRIATTRTKADGTFTFVRSAKVRGHRVRVGAPIKSTATAFCEAGSSNFIGA